MQLCQLACDDYVLRRSKDSFDVGEGVQNPMRCFIKNVRHLVRRRLTSNELFKRGLTLTRFGRQKTVKGESLGWEATGDQTANGSVRSRNRIDVNTGGNGRSRDLSSGICNSRCTGIADDGDPRALLQLRYKLLGTRSLIVHVVTHGWGLNREVIQQLLC